MDYRKKRIDSLAGFVIDTSSVVLNNFYRVNFQNTERLALYADQGFVLLPKHQSNLDILFEGMLLRKIGRYGNYVMKDGLPKCFEYLGGISIMRIKDLRKDPDYHDREKRAEMITVAKERREEVEDELSRLLDADEIIVAHIEGKRHYHQKAKINRANLQRFLDIQRRLGKQISFVPLDIIYSDLGQFRSEVSLNVGNPIKVADEGIEDLARHLANEIELLEA